MVIFNHQSRKTEAVKDVRGKCEKTGFFDVDVAVPRNSYRKNRCVSWNRGSFAVKGRERRFLSPQRSRVGTLGGVVRPRDVYGR